MDQKPVQPAQAPELAQPPNTNIPAPPVPLAGQPTGQPPQPVVNLPPSDIPIPPRTVNPDLPQSFGRPLIKKPRAEVVEEKIHGLPPTEQELVDRVRRGKIIKTIILGFMILLLLSATGAGAAWYFYFTNPKLLVAKAGKLLSEADSWEGTLTLPETDSRLGLTYFKDENVLSEIRLELRKIADKPDENLTLTLKINKDTGYFLPQYSKAENLEGMIKDQLPGLLTTQTFALVKPVLIGEKWLYFELPKTVSQPGGPQVSQAQINALMEKFFASIKFRQVNRFYIADNKRYTELKLGFHKDKLVDFANGLKDLDWDVKVSQINSLVKIINSSDDWDNDLLIALVDSKGYLTKLTIKIPSIDPKVIEDSLQENLKDSQGIGGVMEDVQGKIDSLFEKRQPGQLQEIGTITLTDYNQVRPVKQPMDTVNFTQVWLAFQTEILPGLVQALGQGFQSMGEYMKQGNYQLPPSSLEKQSPGSTNLPLYQLNQGEL